MTAAHTIKMTGTADTRQSKGYAHLPFTMPSGIRRIDVYYDYSDPVSSDPLLLEGNTVDIGIFDARGADFMAAGFRGWSGSARQSFFITPDSATPGYTAGPLQPGTWHICLGLYKIAQQGCTYTVEITLTPDDQPVEGQFPTFLPVRSAPGHMRFDGWYCGEMHCHSIHSDGDSDPLAIIQYAETLGLDFLAITDHNVLSHLAALNTAATSLVLIPGFEVTTYKGHWNVWGDHGWIDFRIEAEAQMKAAVAEAARRGYIVSCNHPRPHGPEWTYSQIDNFDCIEVWNGGWVLFNDVALEFWESRLRAGKCYTAVGGSDCHFLKHEHIAHLGHPTMWVYCPNGLSAANVLTALRAGYVAISESPTGPRLTLHAGEAMMGDTIARPADDYLTLALHVTGGQSKQIELHTAAGCIFRQVIQTEHDYLEVRVNVAGTPYVRAQLVDEREQGLMVRAMTNPIYIR